MLLGRTNIFTLAIRGHVELKVSIVHSKSWLMTSTGNINTIWGKVNAQMDGQYVQIVKELEDTRRRSPTYVPKTTI